MKLSFICPTKWINTFGTRGDFILALSHLIDKTHINRYERAILNTKLPIILDNGLFENHKPEKLEDLIFKAVKVGATHFFAPDILFNKKETQDQLDAAIEMKQGIPIKLAAVVQADRVEDYLQQLIDFNENPEVDLIGLSILSIPKSYEKDLGEFNVTKSRIALMKTMLQLQNDEGIKWKDCHLLGLGDSYEDVIFASKNCPFIVSNDTSCCFQSGLFLKELAGEDLHVPGGKIKEKVEFEGDALEVPQALIIHDNINKVLNKIKHDK
jgi:hypothetical protein